MNKESLQEAIAKCTDPVLLEAYAKLLNRLEPQKEVETTDEPAKAPVEVPVEVLTKEITEAFICTKCAKVCTSKAGLSSHVRACKTEN